MRFWPDRIKAFHGNRNIPYNGERCPYFVSAVFHPILFILAGNNDMHGTSKESEIQPDPTADSGVSCP